MVSTVRFTGPAARCSSSVERERPASSVLVHKTYLGAGIRAEVDLLRPDRWRTVTVPPAFARHPAAADAGAPWLRIGVVDALDRWLTLPLDQSLVDAERGVARGRAARILPRDCVVRCELSADGLRLARRAASGVVAVLRQIAQRPAAPPPRLAAVLQDLVAGYTELLGELSGPDQALSSVIVGWQRLAGRAEPAVRAVPSPPADDIPAPAPRLLGRSLLDPRQLHSRILGMAADPTEPEIDLVATPSDPESVEVRVRAARPGRASTPRLLARLVHRRSGEVGGYAVLRRVTPQTWAATVPLGGLHPSDVRADVADVLSELPPAPDDTEADLLDARRAVLFLAEWRHLAGAAQCSVAGAAPARQLRGLAARLSAHRARRDAPLFVGGPTYADLNHLADLGDAELSRRLCDGSSLGAGLRALTSGAAGLMAAEVVALFLGP